MKLTIGADPEYLFMRTPSVHCSAHTETCFKSLSPTAKVGRDGARVPVEIRPSPSPYGNLDRFFKEIKSLIKQIGRYVASHEWFGIYGGSYPCGYPLGGHIHFGFDYRTYNTSTIIKRLDDYLAPILLLLADKETFIRRVNQKYGRLGQAETKPYGFEYRTPFCFLTTEEATKGIFTLAGLIVKKFRSLPDLKIHDFRYEYERCEKSHFFNIYKQKIRPNLTKIIKDALSKHRKYQMRIYSVLNHVDRGNLLKMGNVLHNFFPDKFEKVGESLGEYLLFGDGVHMGDIERYLKASLSSMTGSNFSRPLYIYAVQNRHYSDSAIFLDERLKSCFGSIILRPESSVRDIITTGIHSTYDFKVIFGRIGLNVWRNKYGIGISRKIRGEWKAGNFPLITVLVKLINALNKRINLISHV